MSEQPYNRGGYIPPGIMPIQLEEGEEVIDRHGRTRAKVIKGMLWRWPLWMARLAPRYDFRR